MDLFYCMRLGDGVGSSNDGCGDRSGKHTYIVISSQHPQLIVPVLWCTSNNEGDICSTELLPGNRRSSAPPCGFSCSASISSIELKSCFHLRLFTSVLTMVVEVIAASLVRASLLEDLSSANASAQPNGNQSAFCTLRSRGLVSESKSTEPEASQIGIAPFVDLNCSY